MNKKLTSFVLMALLLVGFAATPSMAALKQQKSISCKATAVAEMVNRATGTKYTEKNFYYNSSGACKSIQGMTFGKFTGEYKTDYSGTSKQTQLNKINDSLARGVPIVVQVSPGNPHHWVTILSKSGNSYWIADPADGKEKLLSSKYTLGAHGDYGYVCLNGASNNNGSNTGGSYYARYTGSSTSLVAALNAIGVDSSYAFRAKIAAANGISGYTGTAAQNTKMLNLLKSGTLKKAGTSTVSYFARYTGSSTSIVAGLNAIGVDSSYAYRAKIAAKNGITGYTGTPAQNTKMLNLLKSGTLKKP